MTEHIFDYFLAQRIGDDEMAAKEAKLHPFIAALATKPLSWLPLPTSARLTGSPWTDRYVELYGWPSSVRVDVKEAEGQTWVRLRP